MKPYTLNPELLYAAYSQGYFPMPDQEGEDILWFRPDPRAIIPLDGFHVSRSLRKTLRKQLFQVTFDQSFQDVMLGCASHPETWISQEFVDVYGQMFAVGLAHSVEIWHRDILVGGTYGVSLGGAFFAESKFHRMTDASKVALYYLVERLKEGGYTLLECQFLTEHLKSLGAVEISDSQYIHQLKEALMIHSRFDGL
ncbi:MAG: leucyl/phenylalanyl-tRNA--protein transferase [Deltaproteobacteria bacterium]|nr:leucyl/phenylalanyl-tRNA--protein transferase [Deltaproteobacteria bacterium]